MNKELFLKTIRDRLSDLPQEDIEERLMFYEEMIDDRIEEGMSEEEAVEAVGPVDDIVKQVMSEIPLSKFVANRVKPKRKLKTWEIVLLVLGSPVWVPLLISAVAVLFSIYITIWSVVISVYAVNLSFAVAAVASIPTAIYYFALGNISGGFLMIGAFFVLAGLTILMYFASVLITKGMLKLTKGIAIWVKSLFVNKEEPKNENA